MKNSLKFKFRILLLSLITLNALMVIFSLYSLINIKKSVDDFITYNFDSINAINDMIEYSEKQNLSLINYTITKDNFYKEDFFKTQDLFNKSHDIQFSRSKELGELELTQEINDSYNIFIDDCTKILVMSEDEVIEEPLNEYYNKIQTNYVILKDKLTELYEINEKAMMSKISYTEKEIIISSNLIFFICTFVIMLSFFASNKYLNKLLLPLSTLQTALKSFKDGNFLINTKVQTTDEIGILYKEFDEMSKRIIEFKNSTLGQIMEEKNKSLSIVKSISNPLIVLDNNFKCILINDACENFFEFKESSLTGKHILEFIRNDNLFEFVSEAKEEGFQSKSRIMNFNDDKFIFNISLSTIKDKNSYLNGIIVYFQDITELKKLEHLKQDFISTLSHELKTPLTSIMMGASMLEEDTILKNKNESEKIIETLQEDSQKLLNMIDNLLRLTELENEQTYLSLELTDIAEIVNNSIRSFVTIALSKNIKIYLEKQKNLSLFNIDREKFFWVVNNLISNAIKYSVYGGEIYILLETNKDSLILTVKDFGIGISPENIPKIFDKFYRGNDTSNGTGLGLPLSKQIVELHNGTITCDSKVGKGSVFQVSIPNLGGNS